MVAENQFGTTIACSRCRQGVYLSPADAPPPLLDSPLDAQPSSPPPLPATFAAAPSSFVEVRSNGTIHARWDSVAEGKLAIKELKLMKKQFGIAKKEAAQQAKQVRAEYTHTVRTRGSKMRGGGAIGKFVRTIQTISRDGERASLAHALVPLERRIAQVEYSIHAIENLILQIESSIVRG